VEAYRFNDFASTLYQFVWHEFCDWYIEMSKLALNGAVSEDPQRSRLMLLELLEQILLLLHPIMPFVTEEIWQRLGDKRQSIMLQRYPREETSWVNLESEKQVELLMGSVRAIRNLRAEMNCPPSREVSVILYGPETEISILRSQEPYLRTLARVGSISYVTGGERPKGTATAVVGPLEIFVPLGDMIDVQEERARLVREVKKLEEELLRIEKKLSNGDFLNKAKQEVVQKERDKAARYGDKMRALNQSLERLREFSRERN
jgi:valyl-tRNA synthetase